jgi:hypothetical protein
MNPNRQWLDLGLDSTHLARRSCGCFAAAGDAARMRAALDRELARAASPRRLRCCNAYKRRGAWALAPGHGMTHQNVKQVALALQRSSWTSRRPCRSPRP